jgi:hypothetical protein
MRKGNRVYKSLGTTDVTIVLNNIVIVLSEEAFIAFMENAMNTLQAIAAARKKGGVHT